MGCWGETLLVLYTLLHIIILKIMLYNPFFFFLYPLYTTTLFSKIKNGRGEFWIFARQLLKGMCSVLYYLKLFVSYVQIKKTPPLCMQRQQNTAAIYEKQVDQFLKSQWSAYVYIYYCISFVCCLLLNMFPAEMIWQACLC